MDVSTNRKAQWKLAELQRINQIRLLEQEQAFDAANDGAGWPSRVLSINDINENFDKIIAKF